MRLIDADTLIKDLSYLYTKNHIPIDMKAKEVLTTVMQQPTTYDQNKVVEQLEEYREEMEQFKCGGMLSDMIEVVKAGGIVKENELSKDDADLER